MLPDAGANGGLRPAHLSADAFGWATHLHLSAYPPFNAESRAAGLAALAKAHESGMTASVDAASAAPLATVGAENFLAWTRGADLLLANAAEASVLVEEADPQAAAERLVEHYPAVVVKLGARGAVWAGRDATPSHVDGPVAEVADTTGAGDAFAAGFLGAGLQGGDPRLALAAGTTLAARGVSRLGARPQP
jgi:sugar/nucleoside kinase (ribokinase family)